MSTVPTKPEDAIAWVQDHVTPWTTNAEALKLDVATLGQLGALASAANDALTARRAADTAARDAVANLHAAVKTMRELAGGQVSIIRATARNDQNPQAIYSLAQIPAPADRAPAPPPAPVTDFQVTLEEGGSLRVSFKCANAARTGGVIYRVERQATAQEPFQFLLNAQDKFFVDGSFPNTSPQITYRVTGQSSTKTGPTSYFTVRYGANQQGAAQATIVSQGQAGDNRAS